MARPIKKTWFGSPTKAGNQILLGGVKFKDGTVSTSAYILKQTGSKSYLVADPVNNKIGEIVFLSNATSTAGLKNGQCFILATPFNGVARPCYKIAQYRLNLYEADGSVGSYTWSTIPAIKSGQANLSLS